MNENDWKGNIKVDGSRILLSLFEKYKTEPWVLSSEEIEKKKHSLFSGKWGQHTFRIRSHKYGLISGFTIDVFDNFHFLRNTEQSVNLKVNTLNQASELFQIQNANSVKVRPGSKYNNFILKMSEPEILFLKNFLLDMKQEVDREIISIENKENERIEKNRVRDLKIKEARQKEKSKTETLAKRLLLEFDADNNGIVDAVEGSGDFMKLLRKHQRIIQDLNPKYVQSLVRVSNYLETKKQNIQKVFVSIQKSENRQELDTSVQFLKNQVHVYELLLFHSLNMITSIVENDLILFYEIYEALDKLKIFNSNFENEISNKLSTMNLELSEINKGLDDLMISINTMENRIVSGLRELSYFTQQGFGDLNQSVTRELQSIDSSIKFNNLLTGVSTYQLYKINKGIN